MRIFLLIVLCVILVPNTQALSPGVETDTLFIFESINGEVVIAAENYSFTGGLGGIYGTWSFDNTLIGEYDEGYMISSLSKPADNSHLYFEDYLGNLNYVINFNDTGTYYIHLRTFAADHTENGFFATLDDNIVDYGDPDAYYIFVKYMNKWWWYTDGGGAEERELKVSFFVDTVGQHTFSIYRRDLGSKLDHIWLTKHTSAPQNTNHINIPDDPLFIVYEKETGINPVLNSNSDILIYPNPTQSKLTIVCQQTKTSDLKVEIFTISGSIIFQDVMKSDTPCTMDISSFGAGTYLVKVTGEKEHFYKKIMKIN